VDLEGALTACTRSDQAGEIEVEGLDERREVWRRDLGVVARHVAVQAVAHRHPNQGRVRCRLAFERGVEDCSRRVEVVPVRDAEVAAEDDEAP
jgi:hypothetical protein